jgi:hypothetical protein
MRSRNLLPPFSGLTNKLRKRLARNGLKTGRISDYTLPSSSVLKVSEILPDYTVSHTTESSTLQ